LSLPSTFITQILSPPPRSDVLERQPLGDASRRAARDRHGVEVAEQIEGDQPAVGRDVDVHPAALVDTQGDLARL
jgi:hypothetical protein